MTPSLHTQRLELRPATARALRAELADRDAFARALGVNVPDSWPPDLYDHDAVRWTLAQLGEREDGGPFGTHYMILVSREPSARTTGTLIGVGGFKGPPDALGEVEIGYGVLPEFQRRGYATEAVRAWLGFAFSDPRVRTVVGQTLASLTPSIGVLEKTGFVFDGAGEDAEAPPGERIVRYVVARGAHAIR